MSILSKGKVLAVCVSDRKGIGKKPSDCGAMIKLNFGIVGDAHADSGWHRQVSLMSIEDIDDFRARGGKVEFGDFGENIVTKGLALSKLKIGDRIQIGKDAILEISQIGKECHTRCSIYYSAGDCIMPTKGIFGRVVRGGEVRPGDEIKKLRKFSTRAIHDGFRSDPVTRSKAVPIYLTSSYLFDSSEHAAKLFELEEDGHIYSRISNPTVGILEERLASLEGGTGCVAFSSGQAAAFHALAGLVGTGDHIVLSAKTYGGTVTLIKNALSRFGVDFTLVTSDDPADFAAAINAKTKAVWTETIGNPNMNVSDLQGISSLAHQHGVPIIVDNTFATPALCRPFEWGVDIVVHSATKYLSGTGTVIAGAVIDSGGFDWKASGRFPQLTTPDPAYHGLNFYEKFGTSAFSARLKASIMRDYGGCMSPLTAFLLLQTIMSLPLRMEKHSSNALEAAKYLSSHPKVEFVNYPGLDGSPYHTLAAKYLPCGASGMISFGVKGGLSAGRSFLENLALVSHLANLGDSCSLALHPASTSHSQLTSEERLAAGVLDNLIRFSVGIEDIEDIIDDLEKGFSAI